MHLILYKWRIGSYFEDQPSRLEITPGEDRSILTNQLCLARPCPEGTYSAGRQCPARHWAEDQHFCILGCFRISQHCSCLRYFLNIGTSGQVISPADSVSQSAERVNLYACWELWKGAVGKKRNLPALCKDISSNGKQKSSKLTKCSQCYSGSSIGNTEPGAQRAPQEDFICRVPTGWNGRGCCPGLVR